MEKLISIIIPVYNVEKYIKKCIKSVVFQNLDSNDYEIIIIDDESPDNSVKIAHKLMQEFPQIKLFSQKNKGLGGARNTGITKAKGEYVLFLDSDDFLLDNVLKNLLNQTKKDESPDIVEFSSIAVDENANSLYKFTPNEIDDSKNGITYYNTEKSIPSACNKLYKLSFLKLNKLFFKERIYIEDYEFNTRALFYAKKVISTSKEIICFVQTQHSITRNNDLAMKTKLVDDILSITEMINIYKEKNSTNTTSENIFFNERKTLLTINWVYQAIKYGFSYNEIREIKNRMIRNNLYFIDYSVRDVKKNMFRIMLKWNFSFIKIFKFIN